ncbi:helix-turn-helix domain-containing protein [Actinocorallia sp. API 0066]|uniref:helix-turn-helix domain-containing protein n=1 Tax=Actinocorallia sp. API 0066 TaxID=2896846 RepID=UPI001E4CD740|nr:helix-turn-helix domain-containing protein [Actinocorallia sp. API 0066]MCD0450789.1 helix-turn-helix domain-containing protein [Actinocorallia sp. API 0066]
MSVEAILWALDHAPIPATGGDRKPTADSAARLVLIALAERADKQGRDSWPAMTELQLRTGQDRRTIQRALARLEAADLIVRAGATAGGCNRWNLAMHRRRDLEAERKALEEKAEAERQKDAARKRQTRAVQDNLTGTVQDNLSGTAVDVQDKLTGVQDNLTGQSQCPGQVDRNPGQLDPHTVLPPLCTAPVPPSPPPPATAGAGQLDGQTQIGDDGGIVVPLPTPSPEGKPKRSRAKPKAAKPEASPKADAVVAAYIDGVRAATNGEDPTRRQIANIGRQAKELLAESKDPERLVKAAHALGRKVQLGFHNLGIEYFRLAAPPPDTRHAPGTGSQVPARGFEYTEKGLIGR